jgi:DNA adenine methylase
MPMIKGAAKRSGEVISIPKAPIPFLKWAGGKRKLSQLIISAFPHDFDPKVNRYFEPFIGGGALTFALGNLNSNIFVPGKNLYINDMNPDLIMTYEIIQGQVDSLIERLDELAKDLSKEAYLKIRANVPDNKLDRAARFIYLNKTGFNGLWRVNSKGLYNVPWGQLKNPTIYNLQNLLDCSKRLVGTEITNLNYAEAVSEAKSGDIVYFDPPYIPLSASSSFSKYAKDDFSLKNQIDLKDTIAELSSKSVKVILSNSDTPETREIFGGCLNLFQIDAARAISANASSRGTVKEVIGLNFELTSPSNELTQKMKALTNI